MPPHRAIPSTVSGAQVQAAILQSDSEIFARRIKDATDRMRYWLEWSISEENRVSDRNYLIGNIDNCIRSIAEIPNTFRELHVCVART